MVESNILARVSEGTACFGGPASAAGSRICVLSEDLSGAPDEGIKKFALKLAAALEHEHQVSVLATQGRPTLPGVRLAPASRTFQSAALRAELGRLRPDLVLYAARASTTFWTFVRARVLASYVPQATVALLGLQTRRHGWLQRRLISHLAPELIFVQSPLNQRYLAGLGCPAELVPSGVDVDTFCPVDGERRRALRTAYGLSPDRPIALHVGHLKAGRGVDVLADLAAQRDLQVLLVASSSTEQQQALADRLRAAGVVVLNTYQPNVEHLYQLADCYVFPVTSTDNAIDVPLSVLEACACDLPVVTTRYGGLPQLFDGVAGADLAFVDTRSDLLHAVAARCRAGRPACGAGTRALALPYAWRAIAAHLVERALRKRAERNMQEGMARA